MNVNVYDTATRVKNLLQSTPRLRDDDNKLIANIWYQDFKYRYNREVKGPNDIFQLIADGFFTNSESIRRSRQKLQEANPELRGSNYRSRKDNQKNIQNQVRASA